MNSNNKKSNFKNLILGGLTLGATLFLVYNIFERMEINSKKEEMNLEDYEKEILFLNSNNFIDSNNLFDYNSKDFKNSHDLFKMLLNNINKVSEIPNKTFTISDIFKLIPFEETNFSTKEDYYDSLLEILSNPLENKYFYYFENIHLEEILRRELNKDNTNWINHYSLEKFKINDLYYQIL